LRGHVGRGCCCSGESLYRIRIVIPGRWQTGALAGDYRGRSVLQRRVRLKEAELRAVTLPLIELVRSDPKNLVYFLQEDRESPGHFIFYEIFANQPDFEAHNAMPYVKNWFSKLPELAQGGVKVMRMEILAYPQ
jgi:quinol monooxygenase YgiN